MNEKLLELLDQWQVITFFALERPPHPRTDRLIRMKLPVDLGKLIGRQKRSWLNRSSDHHSRYMEVLCTDLFREC